MIASTTSRANRTLGGLQTIIGIAMLSAGLGAFEARSQSPAADALSAALERQYDACFANDATGNPPAPEVQQACLKHLATTAPGTEVGERARAILDAVTVMKRSGARLQYRDDANGNPNGEAVDPGITFESATTRAPATLAGVGYGFSVGAGGALIGGLLAPDDAGLAILAGGATGVIAAVGFGALGYWLSGPTKFGSEGSWLGSGAMLYGASMGLAGGLFVSEALRLNGTLDTLQNSPAVTASLIIGTGLFGGLSFAAGGMSLSSLFALDDGQVAVANSVMTYANVASLALALAAAGTVGLSPSGIPSDWALGAFAATTVLVDLFGLGAAASLVPLVNFDAFEMSVSTLAMFASAGVMLVTSIASEGLLSTGNPPAFVGLSTAAGATVGFFGTAGILYLLRDDLRPLLRTVENAGLTPVITAPTIALDRNNAPAFMAPSLAFTF